MLRRVKLLSIISLFLLNLVSTAIAGGSLTFSSQSNVSVKIGTTNVVTVVANLPADRAQNAAAFVMNYSISGGADAAKFSIGQTSGNLVLNNAPIAVELNNVYDVDVTATYSPPADDKINQPQYSSYLNGTQNLTVTVSDATDSTAQIDDFISSRMHANSGLLPTELISFTGASDSHDSFLSVNEDDVGLIGYTGNIVIKGANNSSNQIKAGDVGLWTNLFGSISTAGSTKNNLLVGYAGAHYFVSPDFLVGALAQLDYATASNISASSTFNGLGFMVGPYLAGKIPDTNLSYEASANFGATTNNITPFGTYTDSFQTMRAVVSGKLSGNYTVGKVKINPLASMSFSGERVAAYVSDVGGSATNMASETVTSGQLILGSDFSIDIDLDSGAVLTPKVSLSGVVNWGVTSTNTSTVFVLGNGAMRGRVDLGATLKRTNGMTITGGVFYDGIGKSSYSALGGQINLSMPLN